MKWYQTVHSAFCLIISKLKSEQNRFVFETSPEFPEFNIMIIIPKSAQLPNTWDIRK